MKKYVFFIILFFLAGFIILGKVLDLESERVINQLYPRDTKGVIKGVDTFKYKIKDHDEAIVLLHGFLETPEVFHELIEVLKKFNEVDIYAPLLPGHGRNLESASKISVDKTLLQLERYLNELAKKYKKITVLGLSYGGGLLAGLSKDNKTPKNAQLILLSPSVYIIDNTFMSRVMMNLYSLWRNYCNYKSLGCEFPVYESGETYAMKYLEEEINLKYKVVSATKQLYDLDLKTRGSLQNYKRPFAVIIAKNDNRISYEKLFDQCKKNQCCEFIGYDSGKHLLLQSTNKKKLQDKIIAILRTKINCSD